MQGDQPGMPGDPSQLGQAADQPIRFPLITTLENRDSSTQKDAKLVNGYVEIRDQEAWVYKRPGLALYGAYASAAGNGLFSWLGNILHIAGATLYKNGVSASAVALDTTGGLYTFSTSLGDTPKVFFQNGVKAYTYDNTTVVEVPVAVSTAVAANTLTIGSPVISGMTSTTGLVAGDTAVGEGVPEGATILSVDSGTQVTLDTNVETLTPVYYTGTTIDTISNGGYVKLALVSPSAAGVPLNSTLVLTNNYSTFYATTAIGSSNGNAAVADFTGYNVNARGFPVGIKLTFSVTPPSAVVPITFYRKGTPVDGYVKGSAYLDGTTYMLTPKSYINGSAFNNPSDWPFLNNIAALIEPDAGVFLTWQAAYIVAFKLYSVESFYDAGNATGSPLSPVKGAKVNTGCRSAGSVQAAGDYLFWIGQTRNGSVSIMQMENLQAKKISTTSIDKILQSADYTTVYSWVADIGSHMFYGVTLKLSNITLVYDAVSKHWAQWTDPSGNYFPYVDTISTSDQRILFQHESNGDLYSISGTVYSDNSVVFPVDIYTPNWDGGLRKNKTLHVMDFLGDREPGGEISVRHSDDDYTTWSNFRVVDLSKKRPYLNNCGTFRRRALHIRHFANTPMRLQAIEMRLELGTL